MTSRQRLAKWIGLVSLALALSGCVSKRATPTDCQAIFERIVDIELTEQGFRDPLVAMHTKQEMSRQLRDQIDQCVGLPMPLRALDCLAQASSTEQISHECLH